MYVNDPKTYVRQTLWSLLVPTRAVAELPKNLRFVLGIIGNLQLLALRCRQYVTDRCMSVLKGHIP